jgi:hypothetical protein
LVGKSLPNVQPIALDLLELRNSAVRELSAPRALAGFHLRERKGVVFLLRRRGMPFDLVVVVFIVRAFLPRRLLLL